MLKRKLGQVLCRLGKYSDALECWQSSLVLCAAADPPASHPSAIPAMASRCFDHTETSDVQHDTMCGATQSPQSQQHRSALAEKAHIHFLIGMCWYEQGKHEKADVHLEQSLVLFHRHYGDTIDTIDIARVRKVGSDSTITGGMWDSPPVVDFSLHNEKKLRWVHAQFYKGIASTATSGYHRDNK